MVFDMQYITKSFSKRFVQEEAQCGIKPDISSYFLKCKDVLANKTHFSIS